MSRSNRNERRYTSAKERADKQSSGFSSSYLKLTNDIQIFKPKVGVVLLDILPFEAGAGNPWAEEGTCHWERTFYIHRGIGANGDSFICPRMNSKKRCPICEDRLHLIKTSQGGEEAEQRIKDLVPKQRQLFNVKNLKETNKGIMLWDISYHLFGKALDARLRNSDEEDEWGKFFFLEDGLTLKIGFVEKSLGGRSFMEAETIDFRQRKIQYEDSVLKEVHPLDDLLVELGYDDLKKIYLELSEDDDEPAPRKRKGTPVEEDKEDEEDDDEPAPKKRKAAPVAEEDEEEEEPVKKKKSVKDEDDWEEDRDQEPTAGGRRGADDDDDDEEEDDDKPAKKKKVVKDEDEEEEEEEEPAPKKKKSAKDENWDDFDDDDDKPAKKKKVVKEEEEEEEPAPKKKHKAPPVEEEEEEEEEKPRVKSRKEELDEEEEEEEEKPSKKKPAEDEDDWDDDDEKPAKKRK